MKAQLYNSLGFAVLCSVLVLLSSNTVIAMSSSSAPSTECTEAIIADGDCDLGNNTEECGYDGGDCCDCTCISTAQYVCGTRSGFSCLDPSASCFVDDGDDDGVTLPEPTTTSTSTSTEEPPTTSSSPCAPDSLADGSCDSDNNNEDCGYDGGDCCECTCVSTADFTCGENAGYDCVDPSSSCEEDLVEAGTKTTVAASANAYDVRSGADTGMNGCQANGCEPELTRDGVTAANAESRWSCAAKLVPGGLQCAIDFVFEDPQDIMGVEVAFYKGDERTRTVEATINGEVVGEFDSSPASTFTAFGIQGVAVETLTLASVGLAEGDWISLTEVRFLVDP